MTAMGFDAVRESIALAITGAINLRMFGPTAQVTWRRGQSWIHKIDKVRGSLPSLQ